ncbi:peptidase M4 family protein, partial [Bacteroidetes/Chlorobi group bacterium Naka2016]
MKRIIFLLAFSTIYTLVAFGQINTFDLLRKVKNKEPLPNQKVNLDYEKIIQANKNFAQLKQFFQTTRKEQTSSSKPKTLMLPKNIISPEADLQFSDNIQIQYDEKYGTPCFIQANGNQPLIKAKYYNFTLSKTIFHFIGRFGDEFQLKEPKNELVEKEIIKTSDGGTAIRYQQVYNGIPIWGKELIANFNRFGDLEVITAKIVPTFEPSVPVNYTVSKNAAINIAVEDIRKRTLIQEIPEQLKRLVTNTEKAELWYYLENPNQKPTLIWVVEYRPNLLERYRYFIDANTGEILESYQANPSDGPAIGYGLDLFNQNRQLNVFVFNGKYLLINASKPMYNQNVQSPNGVIVIYTNNNMDLTQNSQPTIVSSNTQNFSDPVAVTLHYFLDKVYDYYYNTFSRNSIDGNKKNIVGIVHVTDQGSSMANAFWTGDFMVFGDGGNYFYPLARGLDVIAHEFTHGVVQFTVDLEYKFQSGALNEGFADWGGSMVDREDWLIGEDVVNPAYFPSGTMRDMSDPHNKAYPGDPNWLPAHMNEYQDLPLEKDNGGVHINVGIINKATYLIGSAIGKDKLEKIYYRVLDKRYLTKQANFVDFRLACERAAKELFGDNSAELQAVKNAFDAVGIGNSGGSAPNPDLPPVSGKHYILAVDANQFYLWRLEET